MLFAPLPDRSSAIATIALDATRAFVHHQTGEMLARHGNRSTARDFTASAHTIARRVGYYAGIHDLQMPVSFDRVPALRSQFERGYHQAPATLYRTGSAV